MSQAKRYRYPGVKPFCESDRDIFFGRDADVEQLHDLVLLEKLIVLFGKSGYGKSSLLNAGLMPLLHDPEQAEQFRYLPVPVRLYPYAEGVTPAPVETTRLKIQQTVAHEADPTFLQSLDPSGRHKLVETDSLWLLCKRLQAHTGGHIVLIFDQFEEFFTYPAEQQTEFRQQLAELLYTAIPQSVRSRMSELSSAERSSLVAPMDTKALFSIRADRLSHLDSMKADLPDILQRRYELRPLSPEQARTAMERPAALKLSKLPGDSESPDDYVAFATEPFGYTDAAIEKVVQHLLNPITGGVEAFLLQVACLSIENRVEAGLLKGRPTDPLPRVDAPDWPPLANIMEDYYHQQIAKITPAELRPQAYRLIEDRLLFVHPETGDARRLSMDSAALQAPQVLLDSLENHFLIRREANALGGYNYEICHDRLMEPALASRNVRLEKERVQAEEQTKLDQVKQLEALRRETAAEKRRRQRANILAGAAVVGLLIAVWQFLESNKAKQQAEDALLTAQQATETANAQLRTALEEQLKRQILELESSHRKVDIFSKGDENELVESELRRNDSLDILIMVTRMQLDSIGQK